MDFHLISDLSIDEAKNAHILDQAVQDKYNVKYRQFWVNEKAGKAFCLIEGPNKASCEQVHREAHGNIACEIVEVEPGFYDLFMGDQHEVEAGLVKNIDGTVDPGYRCILVVDIIGKTTATSSRDYKVMRLSQGPRKLVRSIISKFQGKEITHLDYDGVVGVFISPEHATVCALDTQKELERNKDYSENSQWGMSFRIGLSVGQPVTENDGFFEDGIRKARRLALSAINGEIVASTMIEELGDIHSPDTVKVITPGQETFLNEVCEVTENSLSDYDFTVSRLCQDVGVSRAQMHRRMHSIAGRSAAGFIRDMRMKKALAMIKDHRLNISEIAHKVGYSQGYFTKCFQDTYGVAPSKMVG